MRKEREKGGEKRALFSSKHFLEKQKEVNKGGKIPPSLGKTTTALVELCFSKAVSKRDFET